MDSLVESNGIITRFDYKNIGSVKEINNFLGLMVLAIKEDIPMSYSVDPNRTVRVDPNRTMGYHITYTTETTSIDIVISLDSPRIKEYFYVYKYENGWNKRLNVDTTERLNSIRRFMDLSDESVMGLSDLCRSQHG